MLSRAERRFLESRRVACLATADARGAPHVVPVCFAVAEAGIYMTIDATPKRVAARALTRGKSLLPAGVTGVSGKFGRGDPVMIVGPDGVIGRGLARYTSVEAAAISGRQSGDIEAILGYPGRAALVHRDDMVT